MNKKDLKKMKKIIKKLKEKGRLNKKKDMLFLKKLYKDLKKANKHEERTTKILKEIVTSPKPKKKKSKRKVEYSSCYPKGMDAYQQEETYSSCGGSYSSC